MGQQKKELIKELQKNTEKNTFQKRSILDSSQRSFKHMDKKHCDKCEKPIKSWQHYFEILSHHPESINSWDERRKEYHVTCFKSLDLNLIFGWHIKGEY